jgi:hypothetical protein
VSLPPPQRPPEGTPPAILKSELLKDISDGTFQTLYYASGDTDPGDSSGVLVDDLLDGFEELGG